MRRKDRLFVVPQALDHDGQIPHPIATNYPFYSPSSIPDIYNRVNRIPFSAVCQGGIRNKKSPAKTLTIAAPSVLQQPKSGYEAEHYESQRADDGVQGHVDLAAPIHHQQKINSDKILIKIIFQQIVVED